MGLKKPSAREIAAANQNRKEKEYWLNKLSGQPQKSGFPFYRKPGMVYTGASDLPEKMAAVSFSLTGEVFDRLMKIGSQVDQKLHILLAAGLTALLDRYTDNRGDRGDKENEEGRDITIGTPIYKQEKAGEFINTVVALRNRLTNDMTFKELILQMMQTVKEAFEHQDYPLGILVDQLNFAMEDEDDEFPLFDTVMLLENLQERVYLEHIEPYMNTLFSFLKTPSSIEMAIMYRCDRYERSYIEGTGRHFENILCAGLAHLDTLLSRIDMLSEEEKHRLVEEFNDTARSYPTGKTIHQWFEEQAARTPEKIAVVGSRQLAAGKEAASITYRELNKKANQLARLLCKNGVGEETVVGIMVEPGIDMIAALLAILKAGGAYLPIDADLPIGRVLFMLEEAGAAVLLTDSRSIKGMSFTALQGIESRQDSDSGIVLTRPQPPVKDFDSLPMPDRSLINLAGYKNKIGMASVIDCISMQATRGCPYECLFCHKVWSKKHVYRSAENIFNEVEFYYRQGVRNFAFIDDCFNLNRENSTRFFNLIIKNKLNLQIFFPNGLRGDLLTTDYIDLMVEAGTRGINLSLETASPRLQKLIKKYLDIDKFKQAMDYIAEQHPHVILEIATMHGFPTETEEEAIMTLDFIKSIHWLHFPYIHILKVYPNTEMEAFALEQGISRAEILASRDLAFHELPETLPFSKSFTREYQSDFMNNYFLLKERLKQVLPVQLEVMGEAAAAEKYNTYLPVEIKSLRDILEFTRLKEEEMEFPANNSISGFASIFDIRPQSRSPEDAAHIPSSARKILFLDLSQHFSSRSMLYNVVEQPLGEIALLTYLKQRFGDQISGRIYKAGIDFDSYEELKTMVDVYNPDLVGIRALTFFKEFFHETVSLLRQWGITVPVIAGGPYATSDYHTVLKDRNVDLVVLGEGEYTLEELIRRMLANDFKIPGPDVLKEIPGIAFMDRHRQQRAPGKTSRAVILWDQASDTLEKEDTANLIPAAFDDNLAYVMYTSGSTGVPKGVMVEHRQVNNCIWWMQEKFSLGETDAVVQRTNPGFDPSVWEIFWPLYVGGKVEVLDKYQRKDAGYLVQLMANPGDLTMMYCPATLVSAMTYVLNNMEIKPVLTLPWLIIGAEPISMETVRNFYFYYRGKIVNTYGPTECTINNTYYDLAPDDSRPVVPIGRPVANNNIYILSTNHHLLPVNTAGEICIAGAGVARGYLNRPDLTAGKFIEYRSYRTYRTHVLYKTGDIGRWLEDGVIEIMGRVDEQVKIRGHRIERGEIERILAAHHAVKESLVIAADNEKLKQEIRTCKKCGIGTNYPGIRINEDGICDVCENLSRYKRFFNVYFRNLEDLKHTIREVNRENESPYDCLLLYAGGRGAGYALYQMVDMGLKVLAVTYDNGYFSKKDLENIKKITNSVGVDHLVLTHKNSHFILKESMNTAHTVCRGCFHTSSSLAVEYAYNHNIKVVVGATLSRGQIIENKLFMFAHQSITDVVELEEEILKVQRSAPDIDKKIFAYIGIDNVNDKTAYEKVITLDFYRYCDITNEEMICYLNKRDPYWKTRKDYAIYSTNCPIKQIGDFGHLQGAGFHYYGSATSWEKRLDHITLENLKSDLQCHVTRRGYENFLRRLGTLPPELARRDEKYLIAYIVPHKHDREFEFDSGSLRKYMADKLPPYMIPSYFVELEEIPLTANGKVDKQKLPAPEFQLKSGAQYVKPRGKTEEILAAVWHEVLGIPLDRIGVDDNFFELGGDSIKAIQITARLQNHKLKLDISQLFLNSTIRKLAGIVRSSDRQIPQEPAAGELPLTPIQHWFFENNFIPRHHFNQSVMLCSREGFNEEYVKKVFTRIVEHHDALRMVFKGNEAKGGVIQFNRPIEPPLFDLEVIDLEDKGDKEIETVVPGHAQKLQRSIELVSGPLVKLGLFKTGPGRGDHLLIIIHHLVMDGVSWRILLEDFEVGYAQVREGMEINFQDKTDSFKYWSEKLSAYSRTADALKELDYWKKIEDSAAEVPGLPADYSIPSEQRRLADIEGIMMTLDEVETEKLLKDVHKAFNTEINDILLTGLALAVKEWAGPEKVVIKLEGHGREPIMDDVDISRTVGWFTTQFPVLLDISISKENRLSGQIKAVKETLRQIPHRGIGYGILRYLTPDTHFGLEPEIVFNYMGQFGGGGPGLTLSPLPKGDDRSPEMMAECSIMINGGIVDGKLGLSFAYHKKEFKKESIEALADGYKSHLTRIIEYCAGVEETEMTPSDFAAVDLDVEEIESIYTELELA
jgi:amino acid adenylation domain-containing protein/non-ribosomal peptide synthase protein (TIGR01720 family)